MTPLTQAYRALSRAVAYVPHKCASDSLQALRNQLSEALRSLAAEVKGGKSVG